MNILLVHNYYQQAGGEDQVFADETRLLREHGHAVEQFTVHNDAVDGIGKLTLARKTIWNKGAYQSLREAARKHRAMVVHFHNTFPLISPAGYQAARDEGAAVVQTLHNYRLLCPTATFFRDGHVCEDCLGRRVPWPGVMHKCYRESRSASAVVASMLAVHRARGTWHDAVDIYIALTEFSRDKFIEGGLPATRIIVKPNFVHPDPGAGRGGEGFALFVGRLTDEKGVRTLLRTWQECKPEMPLKILGDGPLREEVVSAAAATPRIVYLGRRPLDQVLTTIGEAAVLVFPSQWYEGLPRTIVESYAKGTPVVASRLGSMTELVEEGGTGRLFCAGDAEDLARKLRDASDLTSMRANARLKYESRYTAGQNYPALMSAYQRALAARPQPNR
jgi:glycosyltransferase involved in cell wall biosynthesis